MPINASERVGVPNDDSPKPAGAVKRRWHRHAAALAAGAVTYFVLMGMLPAYRSHAVLLLQEGYQASPSPNLAAGLLGAVQEKSNLRMLRQIIYSYETTAQVDSKAGFSKYFAEHGNFYERWLSEQVDPSRRLQLFAHVVDVKVDDRSGLLLVEARAHDGAMARQVLAEVVEVAQSRVNELAQQVARDQMRYLESEARRLAGESQQALHQLSDFQERKGLTAAEISSGAPTGAALAGVDPLIAWQQRHGELQVRIESSRQFLSSESSEVKGLMAELAAVERQIASRKDQLLSRDSKRFGDARTEFTTLATEAELKRELYLGALRSIATARADASRTLKRVDLVQAPTAPTQPDRGSQWVSLAVAVFVTAMAWKLWGVIVRYVGAHRD